jgi:hypothetical protein
MDHNLRGSKVCVQQTFELVAVALEHESFTFAAQSSINPDPRSRAEDHDPSIKLIMLYRSRVSIFGR